jgi:hypothetical protein
MGQDRVMGLVTGVVPVHPGNQSGAAYGVADQHEAHGLRKMRVSVTSEGRYQSGFMPYIYGATRSETVLRPLRDRGLIA